MSYYLKKNVRFSRVILFWLCCILSFSSLAITHSVLLDEELEADELSALVGKDQAKIEELDLSDPNLNTPELKAMWKYYDETVKKGIQTHIEKDIGATLEDKSVSRRSVDQQVRAFKNKDKNQYIFHTQSIIYKNDDAMAVNHRHVVNKDKSDNFSLTSAHQINVNNKEKNFAKNHKNWRRYEEIDYNLGTYGWLKGLKKKVDKDRAESLRTGYFGDKSSLFSSGKTRKGQLVERYRGVGSSKARSPSRALTIIPPSPPPKSDISEAPPRGVNPTSSPSEAPKQRSGSGDKSRIGSPGVSKDSPSSALVPRGYVPPSPPPKSDISEAPSRGVNPTSSPSEAPKQRSRIEGTSKARDRSFSAPATSSGFSKTKDEKDQAIGLKSKTKIIPDSEKNKKEQKRLLSDLQLNKDKEKNLTRKFKLDEDEQWYYKKFSIDDDNSKMLVIS